MSSPSSVPDISSGFISRDLIAQLPEFEQPIAARTRIVVDPGSKPRPGQAVSIANVEPSNPKQITVTQPQLFKLPNLVHELTHVFQAQEEPDVSQSLNEGNANAYGGVDPDSLGRVRQVSDLDVEQQARMVENLEAERENLAQKVKTGTATMKDLRDWDTLNKSSGRLVRQLAEFGQGPSQFTPTPPGPPPAALTGMAKPIPEMGGATIDVRSGLIPKQRKLRHPVLSLASPVQ